MIQRLVSPYDPRGRLIEVDDTLPWERWGQLLACSIMDAAEEEMRVRLACERVNALMQGRARPAGVKPIDWSKY